VLVAAGQVFQEELVAPKGDRLAAVGAPVSGIDDVTQVPGDDERLGQLAAFGVTICGKEFL
jgi:hypothetical protein